jgi:uncharacterized zinc-type alcohol dehydrogenase-like protein
VESGHRFETTWAIISASEQSLIGSIAKTQEMLDFRTEHGIVAGLKMIRVQQIDEAYSRMQRSAVKYRFTVDSGTLSA